ncbi:MAG: hypothetical protein LAO77_12830 [Acidobacteriia bacterium]|nr:hypothetical protein [Terriglobia bacterium]
MTSIAIDRFKARYRTPASAVPRLRRITDSALTSVLPLVVNAAVDRSGIATDGYVCVRDLHATARLRLAEPDSALATHLGEAIADAIRAALRDPSAAAVHYSSRAQALIDLAASALAGDFSRRWAWMQIGLWRTDVNVSAGAAADLVLRALTREPRDAAAVVAWLARHRPAALVSVITRATPSLWTSLARAALGATGAAFDVADPGDRVGARVRARDGERQRADPIGPDTVAAASLVARSPIARVAAEFARDLPTGSWRALATLLLLDVEPATLRNVAADRAGALVAAVAGALKLRALAPLPASDAAQTSDVREAATPTDGTRDTRSKSANEHQRDEQRPARHDASIETPLAAAEATQDAATLDRDDDDEPLPEVRAEASTECGGLLYLINVATRLALADAIVRDDRLKDRGPRWVLHQIATALASIAPSDPSALAFAGLPPDARSPSSLEALPTEIETMAIGDHRAAIVQALRDALDRPEEPEVDLLNFVCRRSARIVADPGWITVRLALDDVSPDIRRAGLDLDPGWVPWLGVVVRFTYA